MAVFKLGIVCTLFLFTKLFEGNNIKIKAFKRVGASPKQEYKVVDDFAGVAADVSVSPSGTPLEKKVRCARRCADSSSCRRFHVDNGKHGKEACTLLGVSI